jgi:hypothetical protein
MPRGIVQNPIRLVPEIGPKKRERPKKFVWDEAAKARLAASFAPKETPMATPGPMKVGDVGGFVKPTGQVSVLGQEIKPPPIRLETAPLGKPQPVPTLPSNKPAVQRFTNPSPSGPDAEQEALAREAEAELAGTVTPPAEVPPEGEEPDDDVSTILKRFKGSPEEIAKQVAKSYAASEKRMRQLEAEKALLTQAKPATVTPPPPPSVQSAPVMPQIKINPFDHKTWGDKLLDDPSARAKEMEEHFTQKAQAMVTEMFTPLYMEALENRLYRKFPDVVTEENLDVIKAMAHTAEGASDWERLTNAVKKYTQGVMPQKGSPVDREVEAMKVAAQQPAAQAKASGAKQWKLSELRRIMARRDYTTDPKWRALVDKAFAEGRVLRDQ